MEQILLYRRKTIPPGKNMKNFKCLIVSLPRQLKCQQGWSLVEVITVMVIVVVAAAFAAPDVIQWSENTRVTSAAREFYADLNNARVAAIDENSRIVVDLDTGAETYVIFVDDGGTPGLGGIANNGTLDVDGGGVALEATIGANDLTSDDYRGTNIHSTTIAAPIGFTPRGMPIGGNTGEILITNNDSDVWLKIVLNSSGSLTLLKSLDSTDGTDGTWK